MSKKTHIGVVGCGSVCEMYLDFLSCCGEVEISACCDLNMASTRTMASRYSIGRVMALEDMLADPSIDIILNLTDPKAHYPINLQALEAGKSVFSEKPCALTYKECLRLMKVARENKVVFYSAPDTYLANSVKTANDALRNGSIGEPIAVSIISTCRPVEDWHPNPLHFYMKGGGPLYDRGVYFITTLVSLLGAVKSVSAFSHTANPRRSIMRKGVTHTVKVTTPTHFSILLKFKNGTVATMIVSFEAACDIGQPDVFDIFGTEGILSLSSPMYYDGIIRKYSVSTGKWGKMHTPPMNPAYKGDRRGAGILDMIKFIKTRGKENRNIKLASHVIDVMDTVEDSERKKRSLEVNSNL